MLRARAGWITAAVGCFGWAAGGEWISVASGFGGNHLLEFLSGLSYLGAGLYAVSRRRGSLIGWLLLVYGFLWFVNFWAIYAPYALSAAAAVVAAAAGAILVHVGLVFPDGRAATRFGRAVIVGVYVWNLSTSFGMEATWDREQWTRDGYDCAVVFCRATVSFWPSIPVWSGIQIASNIGTMVTIALTVAAFAQRWRRSSPAERRDLRPLWIPLSLLCAVYAASAITNLLDAPGGVYDALLELRALIQIIAPVIIVYGLLNARMATSSVGEFVRDIRGPVDRRALDEALRRSLGDPGLRLLFPGPAGDWIDAVGAPAGVPPGAALTLITDRNGDGRAALAHDRGLDPAVAATAAAAVGLALENEALHDEVKAQLAEAEASRARIVAAGDAERRRVERDLHDGAQQRLVTLALTLRAAERQAAAGDRHVVATLHDASGELALAVAELRELARGIHPAILTDAGLGPAVRALADRSGLRVDPLDVDGTRRPADVEAAAYFVIAESLTNIAKHADATRTSIAVRRIGGQLVVEVADDGRGRGASPPGSGLKGLADRVAAAGGRFAVADAPGGGTIVRAALPLPETP